MCHLREQPLTREYWQPPEWVHPVARPPEAGAHGRVAPRYIQQASAHPPVLTHSARVRAGSDPALSTTVTYGDAAPTITPSYSGFITGDNASNSLSMQPTCTTSYTPHCSSSVRRIRLPRPCKARPVFRSIAPVTAFNSTTMATLPSP